MAVNLELSMILAFLDSRTESVIKGNGNVDVYIYQACHCFEEPLRGRHTELLNRIDLEKVKRKEAFFDVN